MRYSRQHSGFNVYAVEPENGLVAGTLEHRWNKALENVAELETKLREQLLPTPLQLNEQDKQRQANTKHVEN